MSAASFEEEVMGKASMRGEIKERWISELRSGNYEQGEIALKSVDDDGVTRHCCLGVLCDMAVEAGVIKSERVTESSGLWAFGGSQTSGMPYEVMEWAGMQGLTELGHGPWGGGGLANRNDSGHPFPKIADFIEENIESA